MKIIEKIQASIIIFICIVFLLIPLTKATNVKIETYAIDPILVTDQAYADIVYTEQNTTQNHTKKEIKEKYEETISYDYSKSLYKEQPSATSPYVAGSLQDGVVNDTLNRINFYRWLYGVNEIGINKDKMERNQKGAVLLKAIDELTHQPKQPTDMDDDFYKEAYDGCSAKYEIGDIYSGNIAMYNRTLYEAVDGYVNDMSNVSTEYGAVGHRMSVLDPRATQTSFGDCYPYSTLSMYYDPSVNITKLPEEFYAYPSAGYFPSELFYTNQYWSLYVTQNLQTTENTKYEFIYNGKSYETTDVVFEYSYPAIDFKMPSELINELGGSYKNIPDKDIEVRISGLRNDNGDMATYNYTVNFFSMDKILEGIELNKTEISLVKGESETLELILNPTNAIVNEMTNWMSSNPEIATVENGVVKAVGEGTTTITVELEGFIKTCKIRVSKNKKGDINKDGEITATDGFLAYDMFVNEKNLTPENIEIGDITGDGEITATDGFLIYDAFVNEKDLGKI